jgi:uncharacterized small protein (DUF1192 family)
MTRLSQIIAVETAVAADAERTVADAKREMSSPDRLSGISKTYKPRAEDGDPLPPSSTRVQVKAEDMLARVQAALTRLFDVRLTKDAANSVAVTDLKVGSRKLLENVPVTYMLFLERQLEGLAALAGGLPLLDPAEDWHPDEVSGCQRSDPAVTVRGKKVPRAFEASPATKEHPAQVQVWQEDIPEGDWTTVKFSGALPADRVTEMQDRIRTLRDEVKRAREEGNATEITDRRAGNAVLAYVFEGRLPPSAA